MKKALLAAAAIVALPLAAQAQAPQPGIYIGAEGGINWLTNFTANTNIPAWPKVSVTPQLGWMAGGVIGYDFVGPRVEQHGAVQLIRIEQVGEVADRLREVHEPIFEGPLRRVGGKHPAEGEVGRLARFERRLELARQLVH